MTGEIQLEQFVGDNEQRQSIVGFNTSGNLIAGNRGVGTVTASAETFASDTTHFVVAQFVDGGVNDRTVNLWINPNDLTNPGTAHYTFDANFADTGVLENMYVLGHTGNNVSNPSFIIDEVRLGTTWDSVSPIPEPGTLILLGITLGTLWLFRRRK